MKRTPRRLIGTFIAVGALVAIVPASAQALGFGSLSAAPTSLQAGAHSNFNITIPLTSAGDDIKNLTIGLPPGEVGDPNATPFCTVSQLNSDACPANTEVGTASTAATVTVAGPIQVPLTVNGNVYNVTPQPGEPARFGIALHALPVTLPVLGDVVLPPIILQSGVQLRQTDFGLDTVVQNIPNTATVLPGVTIPIDVTQLSLSLFGTAPGTGKSFLRNPTSCDVHTTHFTATSYSGSTTTTPATGSASFTPTNCAGLDFSPSFSAEIGGPGQTGPGRVPTTAITSIDQDSDEAGLIQAKVAVPPADLFPNLNLFGSACTPADFQASACAQGSVVGLAVASSPLLSAPLIGPVMLVQNGSPLPDIGLDLNGQLHLLLKGSLDLSQVVTFNGLPDIPIAHFQLSFGPSPGFLEANRDLCAPPAPVFHADFQGYNGASTSVDSTATVDGCGAGNGSTAGKCKKAKKKHRKHRAAESKKHKKRSCKKKHKKHRR